MQFGIALPHIGPTASPESIIEVAQRAETLGFGSVWALDRLLWPLQPSSKYSGNPRGQLPTLMKITYDPLTVLTFVAARTYCDGLVGPVVKAAQRALDSGNVNLVLIWVQKKDEVEITKAFEKTLAVRTLGPEAREVLNDNG